MSNRNLFPTEAIKPFGIAGCITSATSLDQKC